MSSRGTPIGITEFKAHTAYTSFVCANRRVYAVFVRLVARALAHTRVSGTNAASRDISEHTLRYVYGTSIYEYSFRKIVISTVCQSFRGNANKRRRRRACSILFGCVSRVVPGRRISRPPRFTYGWYTACCNASKKFSFFFFYSRVFGPREIAAPLFGPCADSRDFPTAISMFAATRRRRVSYKLFFLLLLRDSPLFPSPSAYLHSNENASKLLAETLICHAYDNNKTFYYYYY